MIRFYEFAKKGMIPHGYCSFVNNLRQPEVLCLQNYERLCPAYVMVYRLAPSEVDEGELQYVVECALEKILYLTLQGSGGTIGPSEPMQNDQTCFFSNIFLKIYNIINNNLKL